jgi:opacity protein-like surface antigen
MRNNYRQIGQLILIGILSVLLLPRISLAAEWSFESSISLLLGHETNPTLSTGTQESVAAASIYPRIKWGRATETSNVSLGLLLGSTEYSGNQVPDSDVQILTLNSSVQTSERTKWAIDGEIRRNILFESIESESGTGDLRDTDVGLVNQKVRRESFSARPSWSYALSELSSLNIAYGVNDVKFSNVPGTNLEDYKDHYLRATYSYRITQRNDINIAVVHSAYRPEISNIKSDSNQLLIGISHAYAETTRGRFLVGSGKTSEKTPTVTNDTSNYMLEAGLEQRSELATVDAIISRDVQPSGAGRSALSNQFRLNMSRKISPMVNFNIRANIFRNKVLEGSDPNIDRKYYEIMPGLSWQWTPKWALGLEYQYRKQEFDASPDTAKSNAAYASIYYSWDKQVASR